MLRKNISLERGLESYPELINDYLIPNIAEVIAANNEAIQFGLKDD
jgi:hypothetical protein